MSENIILSTATVIEALNKLEFIENKVYTLFVLDKRTLQLIGTLTDGDIRRYLINGGSVNGSICDAMNTNFKYILGTDKNTLSNLHKFRELGIWVIPVLDNEKHIIEVFNLRTHKSLLPIDAVLMAGGKGERLRPLTEKIPKPLVKVGDKCIIDYNIDRLIGYGVKHINVTVNYLKEQMHEHFTKPFNGVKVTTIEEPKFLGTIGSVQFVKKFYNDTVLLMNSDLFTNIDFEDFYLHFKEHNAMMSVAAVPYNVNIPFGILDLNGRNIKGLLEKPNYNYYANGGIYLIKREALDLIPKDEFFNATDLIERLIGNNHRVIRYPLNGTWIDIGQQADLAKARELVKHLNNK